MYPIAMSEGSGPENEALGTEISKRWVCGLLRLAWRISGSANICTHIILRDDLLEITKTPALPSTSRMSTWPKPYPEFSSYWYLDSYRKALRIHITSFWGPKTIFGTLRLNIAQKPYIIWSLGSKAFKCELGCFEPLSIREPANRGSTWTQTGGASEAAQPPAVPAELQGELVKPGSGELRSIGLE